MEIKVFALGLLHIQTIDYALNISRPKLGSRCFEDEILSDFTWKKKEFV